MMFARTLGCWLVLASAALAAVPLAPLSSKEVAQGYREHRILVRPKAGREADADNAEHRSRMQVHKRYAALGGVRVLELEPTDTADAAIERLKATGHYASVEPDRLRHALVIPNDASFGQQWSLQNTGQSSGTAGADISATTAWDTRTDASSVILAIVDSGIRYTHQDLATNMWTSGGFHGINAEVATTAANYNDPNDDNGHGTHVAGIAGAVGNNRLGISGVAWKTQLMALKFIPSDGSGSVSDEVACIEYAVAHGAKVINASYGSGGISDVEMRAIMDARSNDIVFVAAAGNGSNDDGVPVDNDTTPMYPCNFALDNIVSVASTNRNDALSDFSNYGGMVELAAPGEEITSTYNASDSSYQTFSGTSMAAPHVAGAVALLRAQYPNENYHQIINRLLRGVSKLSTLNGKTQTGGRLNLAQALASSTGNTPFNDNFADRAVLSGPNARARGSNVGATLETNEPAHAGVTGGHSLWWTWTATENAQVAFDTADSVGSDGTTSLDTTLALYTGSSLGSLASVGSNDDNGGLTTSRIELNVTAGTTYQIAVDGKNGATGLIVLRIGTVPKNDKFANATVLTGQSATVSATLLNASSETGEPHPSSAAGHTVWYAWTAPTTAHYELSAFATHIDTLVAVYTGASLGTLTAVASNDNGAANNSDALVGFNAVAGTTYYFQIDHTTADQSSGGDFVLTLNDSPWEAAVGDEVTSSPAVGPDGTIYIGAGSVNKFDTNVYGITPSGSRRWSFATGSTGILDASPAVSPNGVVYIGSSDKSLYAINAANGTKAWSYAAGTAITSAPALASDGTVYFRDDTKLYALSSAGTLKWSFDLGSTTTGTYCSPVVGADGTVYLGTNAGAFYAIKSDGTKKWSFTANEGVTTPGDADIYTTPAIAADGTIYFANLYGTVYALTDSGSTATKKWSWSTSDHTSVTSSIALATDGTLYFAGYDHKLHALTSSGTEKWSFTLGDQVRASSPAIGADGTVYVGCYDQLVYAVTSAGTLKRTYATAKPIRSSPVIANNRLYIGCADAKLYAFDLGQGSIASAWPMKDRNQGRTGEATTSSLAITAQPLSQNVTTGSAFALSVSASTTGTPAYQWYKDGATIAGATSASYSVTSASSADTGSYTVVITDLSGSVTSNAAYVSVNSGSGQPSGTSLVNIATRAYCSTGDNLTIGGFVITGSASKTVLIRAVGPSLTAAGLNAADLLADPTVEVHSGSTVVATNDNWTDNPNSAQIASVAKQIGAQALLDSDTKSSALLLTLAPGAYTFLVKGNGGGSGVVLLEVYDADTANTAAHFVNIATRAYATTGGGVAIGGFVITGTQPKSVLLRAVGPTLTTLGVSGALQDPAIELHQGSTVIAKNDNWTDNAAVITSTGARVGATQFASSDTTSAALLVTLQPGAYTFIASGNNGSSGIVLVEVYDAD